MPPLTTRLRAGLTLVEVMLALVLVAVGLLGIAGSSALLLRATTAHAETRRAVRLANLRLSGLAAGGCALARDGSWTDLKTGLAERWHVGIAIHSAMSINDSLTWMSRGVPKQLVVQGALLC